jgi:TRAP-type transport system small permease protein
MSTSPSPVQAHPLTRFANAGMALCLGVMATCVFVNVVLRYGFGSGIAASEELSRLLFVWMVFMGATAAYPAGEHMAFTGLLSALKRRPAALKALTIVIRLLVMLACGLLAWGAWAQVVVGASGKSVVMGYSTALLPLPAFLSAVAIGLMALVELVRGKPLPTDNNSDVE